MTESASPDGFVHAPVVMLRGSRNYVHSTDLYCELMAGAKAAGLAMIDGIVTLDIRSPITTQPEFHFGESLAIGGAVAANFELGVGGRVVSGRIVCSNRAVIDRKPYDEERIWRHARVHGSSIEVAADTGMKPIEVVTALGVLQHKTLFPPPNGKRWLLGKLSLTRRLQPQDAKAITVSLDRKVGATITRSIISGVEGQLGSMHFILGSIPD